MPKSQCYLDEDDKTEASSTKNERPAGHKKLKASQSQPAIVNNKKQVPVVPVFINNSPQRDEFDGKAEVLSGEGHVFLDLDSDDEDDDRVNEVKLMKSLHNQIKRQKTVNMNTISPNTGKIAHILNKCKQTRWFLRQLY